ncbi:MAG: hypothetical protein LC749_07030, partial [Actinobacteria bacterium]|nr:hypothetical protein [Actinomycetota bacterium]
VPVRAGGAVEASARNVVDLARVDGAVNVDLPDQEAQIAAAVLGLDCVSIASIDSWGITMMTSPARLLNSSISIVTVSGSDPSPW